jgi:hypothetical protein
MSGSRLVLRVDSDSDAEGGDQIDLSSPSPLTSTSQSRHQANTKRRMGSAYDAFEPSFAADRSFRSAPGDADLLVRC